MKQEFDLTRSKRPINVIDESDVAVLHEKVAAIGRDMATLDNIQNILKSDEGYMKAVLLSKARTMQILKRSLALDLNENTLLAHAEIRGQLRERILLTNEIRGVKNAHDESEKAQTGILDFLKKKFGKPEGEVNA